MRYRNLLVLPLIAWLYGAILARLFTQWINDPYFSHELFVPAFALLVLWRNRKNLNAVEPAPSWTGLPVITLALFVLALGVLAGEYFFSRLSLLILLAGLAILLQGRTFFRAVLFPWAVLILMIPIPFVILRRVTDPLQWLGAKLASTMLSFAGVPVSQSGNVIRLSTMSLDVTHSGILALLTLLTIAIIYGYLADKRRWVRVVLACSAVPIAVTATSLRIVGTGLLAQYWNAATAEWFFHVYSGLLTFAVFLIMLFILHRLISHFWKRNPVAKSPASPQADSTNPHGNMRSWALHFCVAAAFMVATALLLHIRSRGEYLPARDSLRSFPMQIDSWAGQDIPIAQQTSDILKPDDVLDRDYETPNHPQPAINLFIEYSPSQRAGGQIISPAQSLPGAGWVVTLRGVVQVARPDGSSFAVNRCVVSKSGDRMLVLYWFQARGRSVADQSWYSLAADSIRLNRSDAALVSLMTPMTGGEPPEAAETRLMNFGAHLLPMLDRYIPR